MNEYDGSPTSGIAFSDKELAEDNCAAYTVTDDFAGITTATGLPSTAAGQ